MKSIENITLINTNGKTLFKINDDIAHVPQYVYKKNYNKQVIYNGEIFMNGYQYINGEWVKTIKAFFYTYF